MSESVSVDVLWLVSLQIRNWCCGKIFPGFWSSREKNDVSIRNQGHTERNKGSWASKWTSVVFLISGCIRTKTESMLINRQIQLFLPDYEKKKKAHCRNRISLNGRRSEEQQNREKGKIIFLPLLIWLLTHEIDLYFTMKI